MARPFARRKGTRVRSFVGSTSPHPERTSLDRGSYTWRDAVGIGYASGPTQGVLDLVSGTTEARYSHR